MRINRPISTRLYRTLIAILFLGSSFLIGCGDTVNEPAGDKMPVTTLSHTILDGKPLVVATAENHSFRFGKNSRYFDMSVANDVPYLVEVFPSMPACIPIYDSSEFVQYGEDWRRYAIEVGGSDSLYLTYIPD